VNCQRADWPTHKTERCRLPRRSPAEQDTVEIADNTEPCSICLEALTDAETLPCKHCFCATCIGEWRKAGAGDDRACPLCRSKNPVHCIYVPSDEKSANGKRGNVLSARLERRFGHQLSAPIVFCRSSAIRFTTFLVPESMLAAFDQYCQSEHNDYGLLIERVAGRPQVLREATPQQQRQSNVWHLTLRLDPAGSHSATADDRTSDRGEPIDANSAVVQRVTRDPRFVCLANSDSKLRRNGMLHLHCRIERQMGLGLDEQECLRPPADEQREPAIERSLLATAIEQSGGQMDPVTLQMRYGEQMDAIAARVPNSEVERVRATYHLDLSAAGGSADDHDDGDSAAERLSEQQARFMVVFNRLHNRICNVCWLRREEALLRCCAHCQMTWYCSEQCAIADWASHSRWCCRADAPCDDGPMQMVLAKADEMTAGRVSEENVTVLQAN